MRRLDGVYTLGIVLVSRPARRVGLFGIVLAMLLGLAASSFEPQATLGETGSASATRLWSSGAELNTTTADEEFSSSSGTISISSSTKRSGDYAYRANPSSSTGLFYKTWASSAQTNKFWFRTYIRIADDPSADTYVMQIGNGASGKISVRLTTTSTLQLRNEEDNANIGSASSALSTNTWYRVEVYVDTTTISSTDAELRLNGASIGSSAAENLAAGIDRLTWGSSVSGTTDLFFDDIAINNNSGRAVDNWPGEGSIVHMQPNGDGATSAWSSQPTTCNDSSAEYQCVDEVNPNDATDYTYSATVNQTSHYDLESASSAGITTGDAIKLVAVGNRYIRCAGLGGPAWNDFFTQKAYAQAPVCGGSGSGNSTHRLLIRQTSGGSDEESGDISDHQTATWRTHVNSTTASLYQQTLYDLPGTSTAPWTASDLDTTQIGVKVTAVAEQTQVTTMWLMVEYVPRSGGRLISSGFELNSATAGMEVSAVTNTPAINSTTFRTGAYALETENSGAQEYARLYFESANTNNDYYARAYLYVGTSLDATTATVMSFLDTSNLRRTYLKMTTTRTLELWDEDGQIGSASSVLSASTWYRIELRMNTSPASGSHVVDAKIDGSSFASASNRSIGTGIARLGIGINASDSIEASANSTGAIIWDDVAVNKGIGTSQNSWPGEGSIIHLRPNADDSTNTAWTNGFANVDEVTPNDATDLVSETTSDDIDDYDLDASSIGASDVVSVASVGVRFRSNTATQEDFRVRLKDSASGIAIESNNISPASTTWTTNATADPKLYPLTAYTRPELSTAWTDATLDTAQVGVRDVLSGTGTAEVTAIWLLVDYAPPSTILVTGTCDQYDQTTDCTDDGANAIAVAVNGTLQGQSDAVVDGSWSISGVTQPSTGDIITVFIDGETTDNEEAVAVTKYDGTGDITGVVLFHRHLTIGSADNQTITNADLSTYDNSVSGDEDIFFDVSAGNDLTVDTLGSYTDEELYILGSNVYQPASGGGGDVTTVHIENDGTLTANSNAITVNGNWQNDGSFGAGTSSVTMNSTATGRTLSGTMTGGSAFYDLTFNGSGGAWSFSAAAETDRDFIITNGTVTAPSGNLTIARNFTNAGTFTHNSGTVILDTTTTATVSSGTGGTTFNHFTSTTATKTIQFEKHTTGTPVFTFAGTFTITGTAGNLINLYSDTSGTQWKAHFNANQYTVTYVNLRDGGCDTGTSNVYMDTTSTGVSNNDTCWVFPINRLWSGGAELQSATAQVETNFNDGTVSINTTTKRSGLAAWRVSTASSAFNKYVYNTQTQTKSWARTYLYIASTPASEVGVFNFNGDGERIGIRMNSDRSLELWNEEDNLQIGSASSPLSAATWYRLEMHLDTTTLASSAAEFRLNGVTVASGTANLSAAANRIQWGILNAVSADFYFDDIAVNGASSAANNWPGEGKIVHMQPNADGDNTAWTDSSANGTDYDDVDEVTPNDGTDYLISTVSGTLEDVNLETASSAGIGSSDAITLVSVGARFLTCNSGGPACFAGSDSYRARIKAAASGTVDESSAIATGNGSSYATNDDDTANLYPLTVYDKPGSSNAWTATDLDSAQIGIEHEVADQDYRMSTVWALVEYVPPLIISGTCHQYDQTTACTDDGSNQIRVAINGTLLSEVDTVVDSAWQISTPFNNYVSGDAITVFIDGEATDNEEANAVTSYSGIGDVSIIPLYHRHLSIGSAGSPTVTNANISQYDNSVSGDEDIFFDVTAGNDLTVDSLGSFTDEELYIYVGTSFRPASAGGGDVTTTHVEIDGSFLADSNAIYVSGNWQNDATFTAGTSTVTFNSTTSGRTLSGTMDSTRAFYKIAFDGVGGEWTINNAMLVSAANAADTFTIGNGTVTLGNGSGDNLEVRGQMNIANSTNQTGTFQTYAGAQGESITVDINQNTSTPNCSNCQVMVGFSSGSGTGTLRISKNTTFRLNPRSAATASDTRIFVQSTGYLEVLGTLDDTGTSDSTTNETTLTATAESYGVNAHQNKILRMSSGLAKGRLYTISSNTATTITRATTASTDGTMTQANSLTTTRKICSSVTTQITTNRQSVGRYLNDKTGTTGYFQIVASTNNDATCAGSTDSFVITPTPSAFTALTNGDTFAISDGVQANDTYEIMDYAHVTAEGGTSCGQPVNEAGEAYIFLANNSKALFRYAEVCNMGRNITNGRGIEDDSTNGGVANAGVLIDHSRILNNYYGLYLNQSDNMHHDLSSGVDESYFSNTSSTPNIFWSANADNNTVRNTFFAGGDSGVRFNYSSGSFTGNTFYCNGSMNYGTYGEATSNGTSPTYYSANNFYGCNTTGAHFASANNRNSVFLTNVLAGSATGVSTSGPSNSFVDNKFYGHTTAAVTLSGSANENVAYNNFIQGNAIGFNITSTSTLYSGKNDFDNNVTGLDSSSTGSVYSYEDNLGTSDPNTTGDIDQSSTANKYYLYNTSLDSTNEVVNSTAAGAFVVSKKHDTVAGTVKIWGEYSIPDQDTETPQDETTDKFNYADPSWVNSFTNHIYDPGAGAGSEDTNLNYAVSGTFGGDARVYHYRLLCVMGDCSTTPTNAWYVYRNGTLLSSQASTGSTYTDTQNDGGSAPNVQFKVDDVGTNYAPGTTFSFFAMKAPTDSNVDKNIRMKQDGDLINVGSGKTIQLIGQSAGTNLSTISRGGSGGWHMDVAGTINAQYYSMSYLGGTSGGNGLNLQSGATVTNLANGTFANFINVGATDTYIKVDGSLIGTGTPSKDFSTVVFTEASDNVPEYSVTESGGSPVAGNYWQFTSATCTGWASCEASDSDAGDGGSDPNGFIHFSASNIDPDVPTSLTQKKVTGGSTLSVGAWTNETQVLFEATATDTDNPDTLQLCVEKDLTGVAFSNTEDSCGTGVAYSGSGVTVAVTITGLTDASEYHWQARVKDAAGGYSAWVVFGGNTDPNDRDFGVDTTACTFGGTVNDGNPGDDDYNTGSLTTLEAAWDTFSCGASGLVRYEVSFGTTVGGTDILSWTNNLTDIDTSQSGLNLRTNQKYYANVRAVDNAGNTSTVYSSDGLEVLPTISLTLGATTVTFSNLNDNNNRTDSKTLTLTTSTNAYGGYVIRQYAGGLLTGGVDTIPMFQAGTYASPAAWPGSFCTTSVNCGYGYTSNDTTIQGSNKFSTGTLFAAFALAAFGDIVADHTDAVNGTSGAVTNEQYTITHKVSVDALQSAKTYQAEVLYIVTGTF